MSKKASVLTVREARSKTLAIKVTERLHADLEKLDQRLASEAPGSVFDRNGIVTSALEKAVAQANSELDSLKR